MMLSGDRPNRSVTPSDWLAPWQTAWFELPLALARVLVPAHPVPESASARFPRGLAVTGEGKAGIDSRTARLPGCARVGTLTFGHGEFTTDPIEELQAGCFA
jgi:ribosomal protein L13E